LPAGDDRGFAATFVPASDGGPHMAKLGVDRYIKRSGSQFLDMFGRRRRPQLALSYRVATRMSTGAGDISYVVILGIENSGRGSAKAPFLALQVQPPYRLDAYGVDGNRNEGLPRLVAGRGQEDVRFGAPATLVVHPGTVHDVAAVKGELRAKQDVVEELVVHYSVAAEDVRLRTDTLRVPGADVMRALRGPGA
jgi:hypothetical protein